MKAITELCRVLLFWNHREVWLHRVSARAVFLEMAAFHLYLIEQVAVTGLKKWCINLGINDTCLPQLLSIFFFEAGSLREPGSHWSALAASCEPIPSTPWDGITVLHLDQLAMWMPRIRTQVLVLGRQELSQPRQSSNPIESSNLRNQWAYFLGQKEHRIS